ncbi:MBL fold metallo-hydrolase [Gordonia sp. HNM0687]|uniref:MBL fold metallo-hydrolase n=1 Tax=Gordonia mangrovi TaxID=2665643 RepID=A0A6L7GQ59_9ACTN|nr:MBL fold metallo-hydrolase [Gordonia mangrovi]
MGEFGVEFACNSFRLPQKGGGVDVVERLRTQTRESTDGPATRPRVHAVCGRRPASRRTVGEGHGPPPTARPTPGQLDHGRRIARPRSDGGGARPTASRSAGPGHGTRRGASPLRRLPSAMTTFVVDHPHATFLVDPGFCRDARERVLGQLPWITRQLVTPPRETISTADGLRRHPPRRAPNFAVATHAHWDHVCGLLDLPGLEVLLHRTERDWIMAGQPPPAGACAARSPTGGRSRRMSSTPTGRHVHLQPRPVRRRIGPHRRTRRADPGQCGCTRRLRPAGCCLAGDAAWHHEQVDHLRQKPAIPGEFVDVDQDAAFASLHRQHLARHLARVIPTHDSDSSAHLCSGDDSAATRPPSGR